MTIDVEAHFWELFDPIRLLAQRGARLCIENRRIEGEGHGAIDLSGKTVAQIDRVGLVSIVDGCVMRRRGTEVSGAVQFRADFSEPVFIGVLRCRAGCDQNQSGEGDQMFHVHAPLVQHVAVRSAKVLLGDLGSSAFRLFAAPNNTAM